MRSVLLAMVFLGTTACSGIFEPDEMKEIRRAQALWESKHIDDYDYVMRASCFCDPGVYQWATVEVRNDKVVAATLLDGTPITGAGLTYRRTVNQMFAAARSSDDWIDNVEFESDPELGYPVKVVLTAKKNIADGGVSYDARDLVRVMIATR